MLNSVFDQIRIISLRERRDRRQQVTTELAKLQMTLDEKHVTFFDAIRPDAADGFPNVGARGCFLSHLSVLREARTMSVRRLLILEDDVQFTQEFVGHPEPTLEMIRNTKWDLLWLGASKPVVPTDGQRVSLLRTVDGIVGAHCYAVSHDAFELVISELEAMLEREPGSPEGGPMHVDGAYSTIVSKCPQVSRFVSVPAIATQRSSRSDIADLKWWDRMPGCRQLASWYRCSIKS